MTNPHVLIVALIVDQVVLEHLEVWCIFGGGGWGWEDQNRLEDKTRTTKANIVRSDMDLGEKIQLI